MADRDYIIFIKKAADLKERKELSKWRAVTEGGSYYSNKIDDSWPPERTTYLAIDQSIEEDYKNHEEFVARFYAADD